MSDLVKRLRDCGSGTDVIRCQDKVEKSYCIEFNGWDQFEADKWWKQNKDREYYKNHEIAKVRVHSQKDLLMLEAAEEILKLKSKVRDLQAHCMFLRGETWEPVKASDDEAETNGPS